MLVRIIYKETLENILSMRFILSLLMVICLFICSGFIFVDRYQQQLSDYWKQTNKNAEVFEGHARELYRLAFFRQTIYKKPNLLTVCAEGSEKTLPNLFKFNLFNIDLPEVGGRSNFMLARFSDIDWVFIISICLSFAALIFTYDSICGEKQAGTLRLMLSNSIPRHKIIIGKYFSMIIILIIPLLLGLLLNLIIVSLSSDIIIKTEDWLRILVVIFLSILYLSILVLSGIFISSRTAYPVSSIVLVMLTWVGLVILLPCLGKTLGDIFYKRPSATTLRKKLAEVEQKNWQEREKFGKNAGNYTQDRNTTWLNPPARARLINTVTNEQNRIVEDYHNRMIGQAELGRTLTSISPTVIYRRACENVAGTGIKGSVNLYKQIKQYQHDLKEFILSEDRQDPDSLHLLFDQENAAKDWTTISHRPVDFEKVPKFIEKNPRLSESLSTALWDIGLLILFNAALFAAAYVSFLKYDVR